MLDRITPTLEAASGCGLWGWGMPRGGGRGGFISFVSRLAGLAERAEQRRSRL